MKHDNSGSSSRSKLKSLSRKAALGLMFCAVFCATFLLLSRVNIAPAANATPDRNTNSVAADSAAKSVKFSPLFDASLQNSLREFDEKENGTYALFFQAEKPTLTEDTSAIDAGSSYTAGFDPVAFVPAFSPMPTSTYTCSGYTCGSTCSSTCASTCLYTCGTTCGSTCIGTSTCGGNTCIGSTTCSGTTCGTGNTCRVGNNSCIPQTTDPPVTRPPDPLPETPPGPGSTTPGSQGNVHVQNISVGYRTQMADELKALGAFSGTENGYELEGKATRVQAAVMLVRLLGKEDEVLKNTYTTPFTDVADWAKPYVGYLYTNGITSGISATEFGASSEATYQQYITFVLRALGYDSSSDFKWDESHIKAVELGMISSYDVQKMNGRTFLRNDLVYLSYQGLKATLKGSSVRLVDKLIGEGALKPTNRMLDILGNRGSNARSAVNYGAAVQHGDYVYFIEGNDKSIYKIKEQELMNGNTSAKELFVQGTFRELALASGKLFFARYAGSNSMYYSCDLESGKMTILLNEQVAYANVIGDTIYYKSYSYGEKLFKVNIDGSNRTQLTDFEVGAVNAFDDYIYFMNKSDNFKPYRLSTNGGSAVKISDEPAWRMNVSDGVIYCGDLDQQRSLYMMNADGTNRVKLYTGSKMIDLILYHNGYIYFKSGGDDLLRLDVTTRAVENIATNSRGLHSLAYINNAIVLTTPSEIYFFKF